MTEVLIRGVMVITLRRIGLSFIFVFTVALFVFFVLFDTYTWGKFVFLGLTICILLLGIGINNWRIRFRVSPYIAFNALFIGFTLMSSLWAIDATDSIIMARTLLRIFVCAYAVFITYLSIPEFDETVLLKAVMWAGYFIALYSLFFYGLDRMLYAGSNSSMRLENAFSNINDIGLACALSCVIQINICNLRSMDRFFPSALLMIPSIVVIAATQSRKALVFLMAGVLGYVFVKAQQTNKNLFYKISKIIFGVLLLGGIAYLFLQLGIFDGIRERMEEMLNAVIGNGVVDSSTMKRNQMKSLGLAWFLKYPVCGIGIANPHILAAQYLSFDAYLHDNFVELLCGGGIVGFALYYSIYVYLFIQFWKYRSIVPQKVVFFTVWLGMMLAMDYGMVSYYSKPENFYFMIHFVAVFHWKRRAASNGN